MTDTSLLSSYFSVSLSILRPPSSIGYRRKYIGGENDAEAVVVLDPVSSNEPHTKDQVAEQEPTQCKEDGGETKPEHKDGSTEKLSETDSSSC